MKYIIEIEDEPYFSGGKTLYRMSGEHVYFSEGQFGKLTPYVESDIAEQAWELARHLYNVGPDVTEAIYLSMNGGKGLGVALEMSYAEAKAEYDAWQRQKNELKIGDEVMHDTYRRCVLLEKKDVCGAELWAVIDEKGVVHQINRKHILRKTGRTFPEVAYLLEKMRNPNNDV